jgi:hypothetical protein
MARNAARLKMGYYPLPESEAVRLRALLQFTGPASVVDPCVGQGTALEIITQGAEVRRYGVELDAERAPLLSRKASRPFRAMPSTPSPSRSPFRCSI